MKQLLVFKTRNLRRVLVFDTETEILGEKVYAIDTVNNKGESLIRFGNETQMLSILVGYKYSVMPDEQFGDYEAFMKERYYR